MEVGMFKFPAEMPNDSCRKKKNDFVNSSTIFTIEFMANQLQCE